MIILLFLACMPEPYDPYNPNDPSPCVKPPTLWDAFRPQVYRPPAQETKPMCNKGGE
jgi:hypothetical protein